MLIPFQSLSPNSRIWIYQSSRVFSQEEQSMLKSETETFLTQWTAHGYTLQAAMHLAFDRFLIIGANEEVNEASGCSIDKSVAFITHLGKKINSDFLDRSVIAFRLDGEVYTSDFKEFKNRLSRNEIPETSEIFNNAIQIKKQLDEDWIKPLAISWLGKYLVKN